MTVFSNLFGTKTKTTETIDILRASAYNEAISKKNIQLIDVRTPKEFKEGAIENALNIDFSQKEAFNSAVTKLDKEKPVYLYCHSGNRSQQAARKLDALGFKKIVDLQGGYMNWPYEN